MQSREMSLCAGRIDLRDSQREKQSISDRGHDCRRGRGWKSAVRKLQAQLRAEAASSGISDTQGGGRVVHAHPTCLAAHAVCGLPIRTKAYAELLTVYGSFEVAPYGRPGTDDIWKGIGPLLEKSSVILLENHGALAVGPDVRQAMNHMEAAEAIAKVLVTARLLGKEKELPEEECEALLSIQKENQRNLIS